MLLFFAACVYEKGGPPPTCPEPAAVLTRTDPATGYRVIDAEVDADWVPGRTVPVNVWYPTDDTQGTGARFLDTFVDDHSWVDAGLGDWGGCSRPLVVYSHGSQAWGGNLSPILRHLVDSGWIAAAPDHLENTLIDHVDPVPVGFSRTRTADVIATIDALEALPSGDPLRSLVDTSRVLVIGHSFGGQTAWLMSGPEFDQAALDARCAEGACTDAERAAFVGRVDDPRVNAVLPLDGFAHDDLVATAGWAAADRPILYLSQPDDSAFVDAAAAAPTWVEFGDSCHETFTNSPVQCDSFDKEQGLDLVAAYTSAFAATVQLGIDDPDAAALLDGSTVLDERLTVHLPE